MSGRLSPIQLERLEAAFRRGADDASGAMAKWLSVPSLITIKSVDQVPIADAAGLYGESDDEICFCQMAVSGSLTGHLILSFDDISGYSLADLLLNQAPGTASDWGEVETSAALESHNIIGCAYLNSLARHLPSAGSAALDLIPSPPRFCRDFAASLLQAVLVEQAMASDVVFVASAEFRIQGRPVHWTLLFVPDAPSMETLRKILSAGASDGDREPS